MFLIKDKIYKNTCATPPLMILNRTESNVKAEGSTSLFHCHFIYNLLDDQFWHFLLFKEDVSCFK